MWLDHLPSVALVHGNAETSSQFFEVTASRNAQTLEYGEVVPPDQGVLILHTWRTQ